MRFFITQLCLLLFSFCALAQLTPPCPSNSTPPSDICNQTCVYCNFNGVQSSTAGYTAQTPPGFCGSIENEQWLGFIAGEAGATFTALPSNCTNGDGIQVALYNSCGGGSPLQCYGGMGGGGMTPASISVTDMIPGETYYFMIDGFAGDQCDFTVIASPPSAITPPIPAAPTQINGPITACSNTTIEYCIPVIPGAGAYTWIAPQDALINGMPPPATIEGNSEGNCVTITFGSQSGVICVNGANSCFTGPPLCQPIVVDTLNQQAQTILPDTSICQENLPYVLPWGDSATISGIYSANLPSTPCDSFVQQNVIVPNSAPTILPPVALGDTLTICGQTYDSLGTYTVTCIDMFGCDSLIQFSILDTIISSNILTGPSKTCPNASEIYCTPQISNTTAYIWDAPSDALINGMSPPATISGTNGNCVTISFGSQSGTICVTGTNGSQNSATLCNPVVIAPIPPTQMVDTIICQDDLPYVTSWGQNVNNTGVYDHNFITQSGCDSVVRQFVFIKIPIPTVLPPTTLCNGDSLTVCGVAYFDQGNYQAICTGIEGCDSTVNFTLITPILEATIEGAQDLSNQVPVVTLNYAPSPGSPTWYSNGTIVGTDPTLDVTIPGVYILGLDFTVGSGTCVAYDTVIIGGTISAEYVVGSSELRIQPTISSDLFYIFSEKSPMQHIRIMDMRGRLIFEEKIQDIQSYTLDASTYPSGTYQVLILMKGKWVVDRILKI